MTYYLISCTSKSIKKKISYSHKYTQTQCCRRYIFTIAVKKKEGTKFYDKGKKIYRSLKFNNKKWKKRMECLWSGCHKN